MPSAFQALVESAALIRQNPPCSPGSSFFSRPAVTAVPSCSCIFQRSSGFCFSLFLRFGLKLPGFLLHLLLIHFACAALESRRWGQRSEWDVLVGISLLLWYLCRCLLACLFLGFCTCSSLCVLLNAWVTPLFTAWLLRLPRR